MNRIGRIETEAAADLCGSSGAHPRGLYTLFFTEMWERFSYYGMRALLVLFMVDAVRGGMGLTDQKATAIYGLYTAGVYLACLPGGWIADRFLGAQRAVWYGGLIIASGHLAIGISGMQSFYLGLVLIVAGTGLLKPNISAIVGELYPEGGARRDAGFTLFYMGINLGAALGPLVCGTLKDRLNWRFGFAAAGVGMVLGLIQFRLFAKHLGTAGLRSDRIKSVGAKERTVLAAAAGGTVLLLALCLSGVVPLDPVWIAGKTAWVLGGIAVCYFAYVLLRGRLDAGERMRVGGIAILFVTSAMFWAGFEQMGSSFNLFAERYTARHIGALNFDIPTGWFQSVGAVFIIVLAPVMGAAWVALARRRIEPPIAVKFGLGLLFMGAGFLVMTAAAHQVVAGGKAWPTWLITTYFLHTVGELCLSPVGLSSVTKLAPKRLVGQMMGTWFLATSLGNLIAGLVAGQFKADDLQEMPAGFLRMVILPVVTGVLMLAAAKPLAKWMTEPRRSV